jgi:hypothetical protein
MVYGSEIRAGTPYDNDTPGTAVPRHCRYEQVMKKLFIIAGVIGLFATANAATFGFSRITSNSSDDVAGQLWVDVTDPGANQVMFTLRNEGPIASVIANIYWDDASPGNLGGFVSFSPSAGVSFREGGNPSDLPSGNAVGFVATARDRARSPAPINGIGPDESLGVLFSLLNGVTFEGLLDDMNQGQLRVGLHVISIGLGGQSDSYVNDGPPRVPDASLTAMLLGMAMLGLEGLRRRMAK